MALPANYKQVAMQMSSPQSSNRKILVGYNTNDFSNILSEV